MKNRNQKVQKKKEYNPFASKMIKRATVGEIKCFIRAIKPNPKDAFGRRKLEGSRYAMNGHVSFSPDVPRYSEQTVYYYEVGASDGSYRKCLTRDEAERLFEVLIEFEKRQTEIR